MCPKKSYSSEGTWKRCQDNERQKVRDISSNKKDKKILIKNVNYFLNYI